MSELSVRRNYRLHWIEWNGKSILKSTFYDMMRKIRFTRNQFMICISISLVCRQLYNKLWFSEKNQAYPYYDK